MDSGQNCTSLISSTPNYSLIHQEMDPWDPDSPSSVAKGSFCWSQSLCLDSNFTYWISSVQDRFQSKPSAAITGWYFEALAYILICSGPGLLSTPSFQADSLRADMQQSEQSKVDKAFWLVPNNWWPTVFGALTDEVGVARTVLTATLFTYGSAFSLSQSPALPVVHHTHITCLASFIFLYFFNLHLRTCQLVAERGGGRERERDEHGCERETPTGHPSRTRPDWD